MKSIGKRIQDLRKSRGLTQLELSKKIDTTQGRVSKWESEENEPDTASLFNLAKFFEMSVDELLGNIPVAQDGTAGRKVRIVGDLAAGDWIEAIDDESEDAPQLSVFLPDSWDDVPITGFMVRGPSMNKVYPDGAVVYVAPIDRVPSAPSNGDMVVAIRQDANGLYERSIKEYVVGPDGKPWLWPRSDDPLHQTPLQYKKNGRSADTVRVAGVVIAHMALSATATRRPSKSK